MSNRVGYDQVSQITILLASIAVGLAVAYGIAMMLETSESKYQEIVDLTKTAKDKNRTATLKRIEKALTDGVITNYEYEEIKTEFFINSAKHDIVKALNP